MLPPRPSSLPLPSRRHHAVAVAAAPSVGVAVAAVVPAIAVAVAISVALVAIVLPLRCPSPSQSFHRCIVTANAATVAVVVIDSAVTFAVTVTTAFVFAIAVYPPALTSTARARHCPSLLPCDCQRSLACHHPPSPLLSPVGCCLSIPPADGGSGAIICPSYSADSSNSRMHCGMVALGHLILNATALWTRSGTTTLILGMLRSWETNVAHCFRQSAEI